ncbi:MAG: hypothetical protein KDE20_19505, partial [Caldilineaceae bacterium]|nr:hypothetical protein [Caldilineaceae bacterium]
MRQFFGRGLGKTPAFVAKWTGSIGINVFLNPTVSRWSASGGLRGRDPRLFKQRMSTMTAPTELQELRTLLAEISDLRGIEALL